MSPTGGSWATHFPLRAMSLSHSSLSEAILLTLPKKWFADFFRALPQPTKPVNQETNMSFLDTAWADIESTVTKDAAYVEAAVASVFAAEKITLAPILEEALTLFAGAISANPTPAGVAAAAGAAWASVAPKLEGAAISTGITTLVTAMTTGMNTAIAANPAPAPVAAS